MYPKKGLREAYGPLFQSMSFFVSFRTAENNMTRGIFEDIIEICGGEVTKKFYLTNCIEIMRIIKI